MLTSVIGSILLRRLCRKYVMPGALTLQGFKPLTLQWLETGPLVNEAMT